MSADNPYEVVLSPRFPELIDSTLRSDYVDCGHKFELHRIFGLAPLGGSVHLIAGGAFAKGVEVVRRRYYGEGADEETAICDGVIAALAHYGNFDPGERYVHKSAERVAYALVEYFCQYPLATDKVKPYIRPDGTPAIEFEFSFPLETKHPETGNPLLYGGRFDMVGDYMSNLWVVDEKTATRLGPTWLKGFSLRGQLLGYCFAAKSFGLPVNGFIVRGVSFLKDYYGHAEVIEVVPEYRLRQWREQVEIDAAKMVRDWEEGRFSYAYGDACNAYGRCPFRDTLCNKENWQDWWRESFEVSYWNPLDVKPHLEDSPIIPGSFASE